MTYAEQRKALIEYLRMKTEQGDWRGVSDAACDLREIEAQQRGNPQPTGTPS
ncbi:MAG: hypothetical protein ACRD3F_15200 [Acidobacteriaceae bacterium]